MSFWATATATKKSMWLIAGIASLALHIAFALAFAASPDAVGTMFGWFARPAMIFGWIAASLVEGLFGSKAGDSRAVAIGIGLFVQAASLLLYAVIFYGLMWVTRPAEADWWPRNRADKD